MSRKPGKPSDLWVNVTAPDDEDREIAMTEFACDKTTDMLLDYGYHILIMPRHSYRQQTAPLDRLRTETYRISKTTNRRKR